MKTNKEFDKEFHNEHLNEMDENANEFLSNFISERSLLKSSSSRHNSDRSERLSHFTENKPKLQPPTPTGEDDGLVERRFKTTPSPNSSSPRIRSTSTVCEVLKIRAHQTPRETAYSVKSSKQSESNIPKLSFSFPSNLSSKFSSNSLTSSTSSTSTLSSSSSSSSQLPTTTNSSNTTSTTTSNKKNNISYYDLYCRAQSISSQLNKHKMGGQGALVIVDFGIDYVSVMIGCHYAKVIPIPFPPPTFLEMRNQLKCIAKVINHSEAKVGITTLEYMLIMRIFGGLFGLSEINDIDWIILDSLSEEGFAAENFEVNSEAYLESLALVQYKKHEFENGSLKLSRHAITHKQTIEFANNLQFHLEARKKDQKSQVILPEIDDKRVPDSIFLPILIGCEGIFLSGHGSEQKKTNFTRGRHCCGLPES